MQFRILGPVEAIADGRVLALGGTKQRALLALLVLHAGDTLSRDRLIDELWGERPPESARKAIQVYVSRLRKALGPVAEAIVTGEAGYRLAVDPDCIDAHRFERAIADGSDLESALALWRGPALADLAHEPFAQVHAARLEDLRLTALELLIDAELGGGRYDDAIRRLEVLVPQHPYRERFRAQFMLALYRADRQADALAAYRDAQRTLMDELGIEPGPRLRELERAILAQDVTVVASAPHAPVHRPAALPAALRAPDSPFVGRERELAQLRELWEAGRGAAAISGEPGIGKTRLAAELARGVHGAVWFGRCDEGLAAPYQPFADALRSTAVEIGPQRLRAELGPAAGALTALFPQLDGLGQPLRSDPGTEQQALFEAVEALLELATRDRRALLVLDDLQWAAGPTLQLLRHVLRCDRPLKLVLVMTYRDGDPVAGLVADGTVRLIPIGGLDQASVAALLAHHGRDMGLAGALQETTNGNPFFVSELVASGRLTASEPVRALIAERVARLSEPAQQVLAVAAVTGQEFSVRVVDRVVGDALDGLDEAAAAQLLTESGHGNYAFAHALVRDTIYEGLGAARRARLHRRVGEALEVLDGDVEALAHHFSEAATDGQAAKAADYALAAGRAAVKRVGYEEAAAHYRRALRAQPDRKRRRALELALERTRYQPLPDLEALPGWVWRRLPTPAKVVVALAPVALIALALALAPGIERSKREDAETQARRTRASDAAYVARVNAEQRPRHGRSSDVGDIEAAIAADARARMPGPILRVECERRPRASAAFEDHDCLAVTADIPATAGSPAGAQGHPYRVRIEVESGRYAFCKVAPGASKVLRSLQPLIRLPRACGGR
jgi:DNA-binding SARP family transcriptional activator